MRRAAVTHQQQKENTIRKRELQQQHQQFQQRSQGDRQQQQQQREQKSNGSNSALESLVAMEFSEFQEQRRGKQRAETAREQAAKPLWKLGPADENAAMINWDRLPKRQMERCTAEYRQLQRKLLVLEPLSPEQRGDKFEEWQEKHGWSAATTHSRVRAFLGALAELNLPITPVDKAIQEQWRDREEEDEQMDPVTAMTEEHLRRWAELENVPQEVKTWIKVCFYYGQRPSDLQTITTKDVSIAESRQNDEKKSMLVILVSKGKTMHRSTKPYCLHLALATNLAKLVMQRVLECKWGEPLWKASETFDLLSSLRRVDSLLETRSVRRGGLQRLAAIGLPTESLRALSRHTTVEGLMRYLCWGKFHMASALPIVEANATC